MSSPSSPKALSSTLWSQTVSWSHSEGGPNPIGSADLTPDHAYKGCFGWDFPGRTHLSFSQSRPGNLPTTHSGADTFQNCIGFSLPQVEQWFSVRLFVPKYGSIFRNSSRRKMRCNYISNQTIQCTLTNIRKVQLRQPTSSALQLYAGLIQLTQAVCVNSVAWHTAFGVRAKQRSISV